MPPTGSIAQNRGKIFKHNDIDFQQYIPELYRILKDNADFYCMTNTLNLFRCNEVCIANGFKLHNILVWEKSNATPNHWYMKNCEYTLFYYKGKARTINHPGSKTVHKFPSVQEKIHPTEKPKQLMEFYIENSSQKGDIILDCFSGSGVTAVACHNLQRRFICIEKDPEYWQASVDRLKREKDQIKLF